MSSFWLLISCSTGSAFCISFRLPLCLHFVSNFVFIFVFNFVFTLYFLCLYFYFILPLFVFILHFILIHFVFHFDLFCISFWFILYFILSSFCLHFVRLQDTRKSKIRSKRLREFYSFVKIFSCKSILVNFSSTHKIRIKPRIRKYNFHETFSIFISIIQKNFLEARLLM